MKLFIALSIAYTIGFSFFIGILPKVIVNSINSDTSENPFKYSHVLNNN